MVAKTLARTAVLVAFAAAVASTRMAQQRADLDVYGTGAEPLFLAVGAWVVFVAAAFAWTPDRRAAAWGAGLAAAGSALLIPGVADQGAWWLVFGHGLTASFLVPAFVAGWRRRPLSLGAELKAHPLRWVTLLVAVAAGGLAHFSGVLYEQLEPQTAWGPWAYVLGAWSTSALAVGAWLPHPWRTRILVLGGVVSTLWVVAMLPYLFLNLPGHVLLALLFFFTAWSEPDEDGPASVPTKSTS